MLQAATQSAHQSLTDMNAAGSNTVSTAEQCMLCMLSIVRNYPVGYSQIVNGGWDLAEVSNKAYDIEDMVVGNAGGGRIGQLVMQRLKVRACQALPPQGSAKPAFHLAQIHAQSHSQTMANAASMEDEISVFSKGRKGDNKDVPRSCMHIRIKGSEAGGFVFSVEF